MCVCVCLCVGPVTNDLHFLTDPGDEDENFEVLYETPDSKPDYYEVMAGAVKAGNNKILQEDLELSMTQHISNL